MHEPASLTRNYGTHEPPSQLDAWPGPNCSRRLFRAEGCFGQACFAADLGFKEIHVDARAYDVMAARGAGGAAGPAPCHQPSESGTKTIHIYCDYCITYKHAGSVVVKAAGCYAHDCGFEAGALHYVFFLYFFSWQSEIVHAMYVHGIYMV
jgi:hypothetical protein